MKYSIWIVIAIILIILAAVGGYRFGERITNVQPNTDTQAEVLLEYKPIIAEGLTKDEQKLVEEFIDTFEAFVQKRATKEVLSMFSAPETEDEQDELNFILAKDMARVGGENFVRLFTTAGYNYSLAAHYLRETRKDGEQVRAIVDELRIIPSGGEWVGYSAKITRMVIELEESAHGYMIKRYYHQEPTENRVLKYEGFIAS